jgi:hypothetical protein
LTGDSGGHLVLEDREAGQVHDEALMSSAAGTAADVSPGTELADAMRAEFCKLRSLRSTYWTLIAALLFNVGFAALEAFFLPSRLSAADAASLDAVRVSLGGIHLSQIAIGVLGVLVITGEYSSGMIRVTFAAVPHGGCSLQPRQSCSPRSGSSSVSL